MTSSSEEPAVVYCSQVISRVRASFVFWTKAQKLGRLGRTNAFEAFFPVRGLAHPQNVRSSGAFCCHPTVGWLTPS